MQTPIHKVGLILLRDVQSDDPLVCITQVKAKNPAEQDHVDFGLPKGTRQYFDRATLNWCDARDAQTAQEHHDMLEPLATTLTAEVNQEIGLPRNAFHRAELYELGTRHFESRTKSSGYDIQWHVMQASDAMVAMMDPNPRDAHAVQWVRLSQMEAMAADGKMNTHYAEVARDAAVGLRAQSLTPSQFQEELRTI